MQVCVPLVGNPAASWVVHQHEVDARHARRRPADPGRDRLRPGASGGGGRRPRLRAHQAWRSGGSASWTACNRGLGSPAHSRGTRAGDEPGRRAEVTGHASLHRRGGRVGRNGVGHPGVPVGVLKLNSPVVRVLAPPQPNRRRLASASGRRLPAGFGRLTGPAPRLRAALAASRRFAGGSPRSWTLSPALSRSEKTGELMANEGCVVRPLEPAAGLAGRVFQCVLVFQQFRQGSCSALGIGQVPEPP